MMALAYIWRTSVGIITVSAVLYFFNSIHDRNTEMVLSALGLIYCTSRSIAYQQHEFALGTLKELAQVQAFPIPSGIPESEMRCESSAVMTTEGPHGAGVQPGPAGSGDRGVAVRDTGAPSAVRFGIGVATAIVWVRRARETGERTARRQGQPRRSKLDPHREFLLGLIAETPDMTLAEMQEGLRDERGVSASIGTIWTFLDGAGLTVKNVWPAPSAREF